MIRDARSAAASGRLVYYLTRDRSLSEQLARDCGDAFTLAQREPFVIEAMHPDSGGVLVFVNAGLGRFVHRLDAKARGQVFLDPGVKLTVDEAAFVRMVEGA